MSKEIIDFLDYLRIERKMSNNTVESYMYTLNKLEKESKKDLILSSKSDLKNILIDNKKSEKAKSLNHEITIIRQFFAYYNKESVVKDIDLLKLEKALPKYLTKEEVERLLNIPLITPLDYRNKAMLELIYATGLRVSELVNLKVNDIDFEMCTLRVLGKGNKERIVPIGSVALKYNKIYIEEYRSKILKNNIIDELYPNNFGRKMTRNGFNYILNELKKKCDIKAYLTPHVLRHSFATHLLIGGADLRSIQLLLGHENINTTNIYTHIVNRELKDNYIAFHSRSKKGK